MWSCQILLDLLWHYFRDLYSENSAAFINVSLLYCYFAFVENCWCILKCLKSFVKFVSSKKIYRTWCCLAWFPNEILNVLWISVLKYWRSAESTMRTWYDRHPPASRHRWQASSPPQMQIDPDGFKRQPPLESLVILLCWAASSGPRFSDRFRFFWQGDANYSRAEDAK